MKKKVILSAGGTGGHLFPAQAVARELADCEILFVAAGLSCNRYFDRGHFRFQEIPSATFGLSNPKKIPHALYTIVRGVLQTKRIFTQFKPDLVIGFGSFFTLPVLIYASLSKIPFVIHEQNALPGKVNRFFSRFATVCATTFPETQDKLKGNSTLVRFPLRPKSHENTAFGLEREKPTLLFFGGSQGAARINQLILESAPFLKEFQIIHFTGNEALAEQATSVYQKLEITHYVRAFEPKMDLAMQLASIAITRAGASTIKELIEYELPALLIPFPFASEQHQVKNAEHFVLQVRGGQLLLEETLSPEKLVFSIQSLYQNRFEKKKKIQEYKTQIKHLDFSQMIRGILS